MAKKDGVLAEEIVLVGLAKEQLDQSVTALKRRFKLDVDRALQRLQGRRFVSLYKNGDETYVQVTPEGRKWHAGLEMRVGILRHLSDAGGSRMGPVPLAAVKQKFEDPDFLSQLRVLERYGYIEHNPKTGPQQQLRLTKEGRIYIALNVLNPSGW
jgi:hypothetical protein